MFSPFFSLKRFVSRQNHSFVVMTGLDPVIHAILGRRRSVDARIKSGHDDLRLYRAIRFIGFVKPDSGGSSPAMTIRG
jgi:hypothetical protein